MPSMRAGANGGLAHFVFFECRFKKSVSATAANFPILEGVQSDGQTLVLEHFYGFGLGQFVGRPPLSVVKG